MEFGTDVLVQNTKPVGVLSPRKDLDNNKLPSISRAKSPDDYARRHMEHLKQLQEKKLKQQELIEKSRKREEDEREKLRQLVLEEAARVREQKKQKEAEQKAAQEAIEAEQKKIWAQATREQEEEKRKDEEEAAKERDDKTKLYHYYRSRHVSFLKSLKDTQKSRKEKEEQDKKKKDEALNKLRENMGINNVSSKLYDFGKNKERLADKENDAERAAEVTEPIRSKTVKLQERPRSSDQKPLTAEFQRAMLEKQKKTLAEIYERKKEKLNAGEEKEKQLLKQREKLKEKVLNMMRKDEEDLHQKAHSKTVSVSLNSLDLENTFAKEKQVQRSLVSLPPIKEKQTNNENHNELSDSNKAADQSKPHKSGTKKKSKKKLPSYPNITDMAAWKKRHRLDPETKVFSISGGYGDIKAALEKRGWIENPDINSPCFDFKWTLRGKDIDHGALLEGQIVNHFDKNTSITTKVGLCKNLRNLIWFNNVDIDTFYPRCFDLSDVHDYEDFVDEFKFCKAESILKQYVKACKENDPKVKDMELKVQVAAKICENKLIDPDELLEDQAQLNQILVSPEEWDIISSDELTQKALALKKHEAWLAKYDITSGPKCAASQKEKSKKKKKRKTKTNKANANNKQAEGKEGEGEADNEDENELLDRVESILEEYKVKFPQFGLNGDKNIWIVKPAGLSRGRGISCFRNLVEIQDYVKGKESQWIAQKYMENPLIVHKRKFDIRQWVLVTDWNPLTVWYYEECYIRFSAEEYETENLENKFVHLTNNSIGKYHESQNSPMFEQNMWRMENMIKYMQEQFGSNIFEEKIKPKMKQIVIWALECVQDMVEYRKNSHEFYGFDFMIDEDFNVWLIEINSSPDMEYSTPVTKRLVQTVSDDIVKVVVDYNLCKDKKKRKEVDTGLFSLIHQSKRFVEKPLNSFGLDLVLEGKKMSK